MNPKRDIRIYRESITPISVGFLRARVWRHEPNGLAPRLSMIESVRAILMGSGNRVVEEMAEAILHLPDVNAVEVTDPTGNGVVFYADWP